MLSSPLRISNAFMLSVIVTMIFFNNGVSSRKSHGCSRFFMFKLPDHILLLYRFSVCPQIHIYNESAKFFSIERSLLLIAHFFTYFSTSTGPFAYSSTTTNTTLPVPSPSPPLATGAAKAFSAAFSASARCIAYPLPSRSPQPAQARLSSTPARPPRTRPTPPRSTRPLMLLPEVLDS